MIALPHPEGRAGQYLGGDRPPQRLGDLSLDLFGGYPFGGVGGEDGGAIRRPLIADLAVRIGRVDMAKEGVDQLRIAGLGRVIGDLDRLQVTFMIFVVGIGRCAASITHHHGLHPWGMFDVMLSRPEAPTCKDGCLVGVCRRGSTGDGQSQGGGRDEERAVHRGLQEGQLRRGRWQLVRRIG